MGNKEVMRKIDRDLLIRIDAWGALHYYGWGASEPAQWITAALADDRGRRAGQQSLGEDEQ